MAKPVAVTNTSPIIALAGVGELSLLDQLFERVTVPLDVWAERVTVPLDVWAELTDKAGAVEPAALRALASVAFLPAPKPPSEAELLDAGEAAAIALAVSSPESRVILSRRWCTRASGAAGPDR